MPKSKEKKSAGTNDIFKPKINESTQFGER